MSLCVCRAHFFKEYNILNTLRPRQIGHHFPDDAFKCTFVNRNIRISTTILLKFDPKGSIDIIPALVEIIAWHRQGDKPLSEPMTVKLSMHIQYIPRNMHAVFALLCFVVVIHWLIFPYPSGLLHWHCGNVTIAPVPAKQPWWIWRNTSCEFIMNDCITTTKQSTTKPCAYFLGYTVCVTRPQWVKVCFLTYAISCFHWMVVFLTIHEKEPRPSGRILITCLNFLPTNSANNGLIVPIYTSTCSFYKNTAVCRLNM